MGTPMSDNPSGWARFVEYVAWLVNGIGDLFSGQGVESYAPVYVEPFYPNRLYGECLNEPCTRRTWVAKDQLYIDLPTHLRQSGWQETSDGWLCPVHRKEWGL